MTRALLLLLAAALAAPACATVRPWEREDLSQPAMQLGGDPDDTAGLDHTFAAREGGIPAGVARGGGCGCN